MDYQFEASIYSVEYRHSKILIWVGSYFYTHANTLPITDPQSMNKFMNLVDQMKYKSMISADDHLFYQWLAKIWIRNILLSLKFLNKFSRLSTNIISQIDDAIMKFNNQKWVQIIIKILW